MLGLLVPQQEAWPSELGRRGERKRPPRNTRCGLRAPPPKAPCGDSGGMWLRRQIQESLQSRSDLHALCG